MYAQFQGSYQRMEQSLQRLTDSIAAYNPSPTAAEELVAVDEEINKHLEQLEIHQQNRLRIQQLQATTSSLDETIKNTLQTLADLRKEVAAIPSSNVAEDGGAQREVKVDELLSYAKYISKTTVPPTFRKPRPDLHLSRQGQQEQEQASNGAAPAQIADGMATPAPATTDSPAQAQPAYTTNEPSVPSPLTTSNPALNSLTKDTKSWLDPLSSLPFEPWPSHAAIMSGALADIQGILEEGKDPAGVLSAEEQVKVDRMKAMEEDRERLAQEEAERRRMSLFEGVGGAGTGGRRRVVEEVFNPDED